MNEYLKAIARFPMVCLWQRDSSSRVEVIWQQDPPLLHKPIDFEQLAAEVGLTSKEVK